MLRDMLVRDEAPIDEVQSGDFPLWVSRLAVRFSVAVPLRRGTKVKIGSSRKAGASCGRTLMPVCGKTLMIVYGKVTRASKWGISARAL